MLPPKAVRLYAFYQSVKLSNQNKANLLYISLCRENLEIASPTAFKAVIDFYAR
jgi:hypothetical protein